MVKAADGAFNRVLAACGVPPAMFIDADGTSQREALRRWHLNTVMPLARQVEYELTEKLETEVRLRFDTYALDMVSQGPAWWRSSFRPAWPPPRPLKPWDSAMTHLLYEETGPLSSAVPIILEMYSGIVRETRGTFAVLDENEGQLAGPHFTGGGERMGAPRGG